MKRFMWAFFAAICLVACSSSGVTIDPDDFPSVTPSEPEEPSTDERPAFVWIDAGANFLEFANSKQNIERDLQKAKDCGFTDIVVDVRPTTGEVLFKSDKCARLTAIGAWVTGGYKLVKRTATWDYLGAFIEIGHSLGLRVHAAFNTMTGGRSYPYGLGNAGVLFSSSRDWATVKNTSKGLVNVMDDTSVSTKFFNPANPEVQEYLLGLIGDLAAYSDLDGIFLDRGRYDDFTSDFSDISRAQFEKYIGRSISSWPGDVLPSGTTSISSATELQKQWIEYRASVVREFMAKARAKVKAINPKIKFGVYVGAWYSTYYQSGVNWASPEYKPTNFWASSTYSKTGYADLMDQMLLGAYASPGKVEGSSEWTIEGFCSQGMSKIKGACPMVACGPDVGNWDSSDAFTEAQENAAITASVAACLKSANGYFLFDMCHLRSGNKWQYVKAGLGDF